MSWASKTFGSSRSRRNTAAPPADKVPAELLDTYIAEAPKMLDFLHERTRVRYESLAHYPDYYSSLPGAKNGHRSLEPEPIYRDQLGAEGKYLSETTDRIWMFNRIAMTQVDAQILMGQVPGWKSLAAKLIWDYASDIPWLFRNKRSRRLTCGCAGIARLRNRHTRRQGKLIDPEYSRSALKFFTQSMGFAALYPSYKFTK